MWSLSSLSPSYGPNYYLLKYSIFWKNRQGKSEVLRGTCVKKTDYSRAKGLSQAHNRNCKKGSQPFQSQTQPEFSEGDHPVVRCFQVRHFPAGPAKPKRQWFSFSRKSHEVDAPQTSWTLPDPDHFCHTLSQKCHGPFSSTLPEPLLATWCNGKSNQLRMRGAWHCTIYWT